MRIRRKDDSNLIVSSILLICLKCKWNDVNSFAIAPRILRTNLKVNNGELFMSTGEDVNSSSSLIRSVPGGSNPYLSEAFDALSESDKYDAVLTGLCAKILDSKENSNDKNSIDGPLNLMKEMISRKVQASTRSVCALIDVATQSEDVWTVAQTMSTCTPVRTQASDRMYIIQYFGSLQQEQQKALDSFSKTGDLSKLPQIPKDERAKEIATSASFLAWMATCLVLSKSVGSGPLLIDESNAFQNSLLQAFASLGFNASLLLLLLDNIYDVIRNVARFKIDLPEKLPLNLGKGQITGVITRGFTRLFATDSQRDCECEAAAFYTAYALGLPCFAFRSNALEAANLLFESVQPPKIITPTSAAAALNPLLSQSGIVKILIWIMSPVAMESMKHTQLISSDPREGYGFLKRIKEKCTTFDVSREEVNNLLTYWGPTSQDYEENLIQFAFMQAQILLRENKSQVSLLTDRLCSGTATVGDCVAVLEEWS